MTAKELKKLKRAELLEMADPRFGGSRRVACCRRRACFIEREEKSCVKKRFKNE